MLSPAVLLACPHCRGGLTEALVCAGCGIGYDNVGGIPDLRLDTGTVSEVVRAFYADAPFPGYPPADSLAALRARAERSSFMGRLDQEIAGDARILEMGCGTGQTAIYLARADRVVIAADLTRASLALGAAAARRFGVRNVHFVETDLFSPGLRMRAFDVVYCSGVLHHTADPSAALHAVAELVRPGGMLVVGLYNRYARIPLRLRRLVARLSRGRIVPDPVLRERSAEPERRRAWLRDQYRHPVEHSHSLHQVRTWFAENGIEYFRSYPSALLGGADEALFAPADYWRCEGWLAQLGWIASLGHEGGLFMTIGRRAESGAE